MKSYCAICARETNQTVLHEEKRDFDEEGGWWDSSKYQTIQCAGCDEVSFRKLYNDAAQQNHSDEDETSQELYPKRGPHSRPIKIYRELPFQIKSIYRETIDAFNSNLKLLCGSGVRTIVEAICLDKGVIKGKVVKDDGKIITSKNLDGKISGLAEKGFLTVPSSETLHELRFLGNETIHELYEPTIEELNIAIDIVESTIESMYELHRKAVSLKRKRSIRKKTI